MIYRINDPGWLGKALADAKSKTPFTIAIGAPDITRLIAGAQHSAAAVTQFPLLGLLQRLPLPPGVIIPDAIPAAVLPVIGELAAVGYAIGAEASVGMVVGVAHASGMLLKVALVVPPGDITKVEIHIEGSPV